MSVRNELLHCKLHYCHAPSYADRSAAAVALLPGYESETWSKKSIEKLVLIRRHLCLVLTSFSTSYLPGKRHVWRESLVTFT